MHTLIELGFVEPFVSAFEQLHRSDQPDLRAARVSAAHRGGYALLSSAGHHTATVGGRLRHAALEPGDMPAVGDWVAVRGAAQDGDAAVIDAVLPRRSALMRARPAGGGQPQLIATNLDHVFVVSALDRDFNPRRLERYLSLIWQSGAQPVVLLSKADLSPDPEADRERASAVAIGAPVHLLSTLRGAGLPELSPYLGAGKTVALVGSSGVGKSTLANALLSEAVIATGDIRAQDGRGRHTTTRRELFVLPSGGLLVDTPGMREVGLWDADEGLQSTFDDIEALAAGCHFADCTHGEEPGCAVTEAIRDGVLSEARYRSYHKLQRELAHVERQRDERARRTHDQQTRRIYKARTRAARRHPKR